MIDKTIRQIEDRIRQADSIPGKKRNELLELFAALRSEIAEMGDDHKAAAHDIAGLTDRYTSEVTSSSPDQERLEQSRDGLSSSVAGFEESHPKLVQAVNRICVTLSSLGI